MTTAPAPSTRRPPKPPEPATRRGRRPRCRPCRRRPRPHGRPAPAQPPPLPVAPTTALRPSAGPLWLPAPAGHLPAARPPHPHQRGSTPNGGRPTSCAGVWHPQSATGRRAMLHARNAPTALKGARNGAPPSGCRPPPPMWRGRRPLGSPRAGVQPTRAATRKQDDGATTAHAPASSHHVRPQRRVRLDRDATGRPYDGVQRAAAGHRHQAGRPSALARAAGNPEVAMTRIRCRTPSAIELHRRKRSAAPATRSAAKVPSRRRPACWPTPRSLKWARTDGPGSEASAARSRAVLAQHTHFSMLMHSPKAVAKAPLAHHAPPSARTRAP